MKNDAHGHGWIFELIAMNRFSLNIHVTLESFLSLDKYNLIATFPSNDLPKVKIMAMDGMYVTQNFNFPEIDMIWKSGQTVFGVQVPISKYHNMLEKFTEVCDKVGWLTKLMKVYLLCLSPEQRIAQYS